MEKIDLLKLDVKNLQETNKWLTKRVYDLYNEKTELELRVRKLELVVESLAAGKVL